MSFSVFEYTDCLQFLNDCIKDKKKGNPHVSYSLICEKTGIKSKGHLATLLQGKTRISIPLVLKFAEFLKLKKRDTEYFQYLVLFNQAKNQEDKKNYFEKMLSFKESKVRILNVNQYDYYDKWYHSVIRAILEFYPFKGDYEVLAKIVAPPITSEEVEKSISLMEGLGLIAKDKTGSFRPVDSVIDTGPVVKSVATTNVAVQTLHLAEEAIDRFQKEERILSGVTIGVSEQGYQSVVQEIRDFRQRIYRIVENDKANRTYQLNIQMFPTSKRYQP